MKKCHICEVSQPETNFAVNNAKKDGRHYNCKTCDAAKSRAWHHANKVRSNARKEQWRAENRNYALAKDHKRYWDNPLAAAVQRRAYYVANKDEVIARVTQYSETHRADARRRVKEWSARNPERVRYYLARRRAAKLNAQPSWMSAIQLAQIQEFYDIAAARTCQTEEQHHVDHIEPLLGKMSRGLHVPWNLQVLTERDNRSKGNKLLSPALVASPTRG